jgi:hypothetical protein
MRNTEYVPEVYEFETKGFVKTPHRRSVVLYRLRSQYGKYLRTFHVGSKCAVRRSKATYGTYDIFGGKISYYYDIRKEDKFVNFLIELFCEKNPNPDVDIRKVFTRILHVHNLHWSGCSHKGKDVDISDQREQ